MSISVDWDVALKIWAVLGPLVAGAASAIWSRRNQIQDREYEKEQQASIRKNDLEDKALEFKRTLITSQKNELRLAITQFVNAANFYIETCQAHHNRGKDEQTEKDQLAALDKLGSHYQVVNILGTDDIASLAKRILNLATSFPLNIVQQERAKIDEHHRDYLAAKRDLAKESRKLLGFNSEV